MSKDYYEPIHLLNIYNDLKMLINHQDANIRAKICNLIGNMCRHSPYFYDSLVKYDLLGDCIKSC